MIRSQLFNLTSDTSGIIFDGTSVMVFDGTNCISYSKLSKQTSNIISVVANDIFFRGECIALIQQSFVKSSYLRTHVAPEEFVRVWTSRTNFR